MKNRSPLLIVLLFLLVQPLHAEWLAVIDRSSEESSGLNEQQLILLTQVARGEAGTLLPDSIRVLSEENTSILLTEMGIDLADCEGDCEIEIARQLQADWLLSTHMVKFGQNWSLQLNLFRTQSAELMASRIRDEASEELLVESMRRTSRDIVQSIFPAPGFSPTLRDTLNRQPPPQASFDWLIDSRPQHAEVLVDGNPGGRSPVDLRLTPGAHLIELQLNNHVTQQRLIQAESNGSELFLLQAANGTLDLQSTPSGLQVRLNHELIGSTPLEQDLPAGLYTLEVGNPARYQIEALSLRIRPNEIQSLDLSVIELHGRLEVLALDKRNRRLNLPVHIDGRNRGKTPLELDLVVGEHKIKVGDLSRTVQIRADEKEAVKFHNQKRIKTPEDSRMGTIGLSWGKAQGRLDWVSSHNIHESIGYEKQLPGIVIHMDLINTPEWALFYRHEGFWSELELKPEGKQHSQKLRFLTHGSSLGMQLKLDQFFLGGALGYNWDFTIRDDSSVRRGRNWLGLQAGLRKLYLDLRFHDGNNSWRLVWLF